METDRGDNGLTGKISIKNFDSSYFEARSENFCSYDVEVEYEGGGPFPHWDGTILFSSLIPLNENPSSTGPYTVQRWFDTGIAQIAETDSYESFEDLFIAALKLGGAPESIGLRKRLWAKRREQPRDRIAGIMDGLKPSRDSAFWRHADRATGE